MAMMKFEILFKDSDPVKARTFFDEVGVLPLAIVAKRVGEKVTDYMVCKPFAGDAFDRVADQIFSISILTRENVLDQDAAEAAREGRMEGLILEYSNGTDVEIFSADGNYVHNMLNEAGDETLTAEGAHTNDGAHRAREGWAPGDLNPTGQAFEDFKRGGHTEGNTLN